MPCPQCREAGVRLADSLVRKSTAPDRPPEGMLERMPEIASLLSAARLTVPDSASTGALVGDDPVLATAFPIGEAAAAALVGGGLAAARLHRLRGGPAQSVRVDVAAAAVSLLGFVFQSQPDGGSAVQLERRPPGTTDFFECGDGRWVHLHGGFPHLNSGTLELLECSGDRDAIEAAVRGWKAQDLEDALAERRLCGAMLRTPEEWVAHPQGAALAPLAAIEIDRIGDAPPEPLPRGERPLSGVRVLDLTRVLAGPTSGRTLASHGAEVLRIAAPTCPASSPSSSRRDTASAPHSSTCAIPRRPNGCATWRGTRTSSPTAIETAPWRGVDSARTRSPSCAPGSSSSRSPATARSVPGPSARAGSSSRRRPPAWPACTRATASAPASRSGDGLHDGVSRRVGRNGSARTARYRRQQLARARVALSDRELAAPTRRALQRRSEPRVRRSRPLPDDERRRRTARCAT